ncbi:MAG: hypothetical protein P4L84_21395 [Isosphaeraceae bacterium]|nr:hypothetical protein [Isosphaeraceae bacterium]
MAVFTLACLLSLVLVWVAEPMRALPWSLIVSLYVLGYLTGGSHSAVRAVRALAAGSLNVDCLMILAALAYVLGRTRQAIEDLMDLSPEEDIVRRGGQEQRIAVDELCTGDTLIVRLAERIAAGGIVRAGRPRHSVTGQHARGLG